MSTPEQGRILAFAVIAVVAGALGFVGGRFTAPDSDGPELRLTGTEATASEVANRPTRSRNYEQLAKKHDELVKETEALRARVARHAGGPVEEEGATTSATAAPEKAGGAKLPATPALPDPRHAAALVEELKKVLEAGDGEALKELQPRLVAQGQLVVDDLISLVDGSDSLFAIEKLAGILGEIGDERALTPLQELLKTENDDGARSALIVALGAIPDPSSVPLLTTELTRQEGSPLPPSRAASSLGSIGTTEAVTALRGEVTDGSNAMVRSFAIDALAGLERTDLAPFFLDQVERDAGVSDRFRIRAVEATARTGNRDVVWRLEKIAFSTTTSRALKEATKRAINQISGRKVY